MMAKKSTPTTKEPVVSNKREHKLNIQPIGETERSVLKFDDPEAVQKLEEMYPEMYQAFLEILFTNLEVFAKKNADYGPDNISLGSSLSTEEERKLSLTGIWFRLQDKLNRLKQLVVLGKENNVKESIEDTYQDLTNYAIISMIILKQRWGK